MRRSCWTKEARPPRRLSAQCWLSLSSPQKNARWREGAEATERRERPPEPSSSPSSKPTPPPPPYETWPARRGSRQRRRRLSIHRCRRAEEKGRRKGLLGVRVGVLRRRRPPWARSRERPPKNEGVTSPGRERGKRATKALRSSSPSPTGERSRSRRAAAEAGGCLGGPPLRCRVGPTAWLPGKDPAFIFRREPTLLRRRRERRKRLRRPRLRSERHQKGRSLGNDQSTPWPT